MPADVAHATATIVRPVAAPSTSRASTWERVPPPPGDRHVLGGDTTPGGWWPRTPNCDRPSLLRARPRRQRQNERGRRTHAPITAIRGVRPRLWPWTRRYRGTLTRRRRPRRPPAGRFRRSQPAGRCRRQWSPSRQRVAHSVHWGTARRQRSPGACVATLHGEEKGYTAILRHRATPIHPRRDAHRTRGSGRGAPRSRRRTVRGAARPVEGGYGEDG